MSDLSTSVTGVTEPGTGVRLVHVVVAPSHCQTTLALFVIPLKSSTFSRPESVTMPGES